MKKELLTAGADLAIWGRAIQFEGDLTPSAARALLKVQVSSQGRQRMRELSAKARNGTLSSEEEVEIDTCERLGCLLDIVHSTARRALEKPKTAR